jgi:hypothetical protein
LTRDLNSPENQEMVLIRKDQTVVLPTNVQQDGNWALARYPIPLADAQAALFRTRPFEAVRLEVAARPGQRPRQEVTIVSRRTPAQVASTQASLR